MRKEQQQQSRKIRALSPSLRDYWNNPSDTHFSPSSEPRRRSPQRPQVTTPSLWDTTTVRQPLTRQLPSGEGNEQTASVSHFHGEAEQIVEGTLVPFDEVISLHRTKQVGERIEQGGISSLSNAELLSLILRTGAGNEVSVQRVHELLAAYTVQELLTVDFGEVSNQQGLGKAKAAQVQAVLEVARRLLVPSPTEKYRITTAADAVRLVTPDMAFLDHEEMRVLLLDTKNYVVANLLYSKGTVNSSVFRAAEIYRPAITRNCPHLIVCHNHPSGDPDPSPEDIAATQQLLEAGKLLDIDLLDHLIIGTPPRFVSLREKMNW